MSMVVCELDRFSVCLSVCCVNFFPFWFGGWGLQVMITREQVVTVKPMKLETSPSDTLNKGKYA